MSDDSFLREVEEELRSDKLKAFWKRYAPFIIGGAVLIVLVVAANEAWKWWRDTSAANASERYYAAVALADRGDLGEAQAALKAIANEGPEGYAILARFRAAGLLAEQGNADAAISAYDALSSSLNEIRLRELALILGAYLAVDHLDVAGVEARAGSLTGEENALRNQAREALGLAYYKAGDYEAARQNFEAIAADPAASQDIQMRAFVYLEQLASAGVAVNEELLVPEGELDLGLEPADDPFATPSE
ncbi:tetratricopeptide repeat protein [Pelagibacterium limicola]|uniref:tetratricopeptide repeat protein n=1 Tax=Pelagibacterium limicola TaxID=2791022 RepID=UPI0018B0071E|nr:tetratricopeptide repeat protein [Pelagibacterium limicola]